MSGGNTRLAPTPSGYLHAGNAINFLLTARLARQTGARLRLRIDDLDRERVRTEYLTDVFRSLAWLGITWHEGPTSVQEHQRNWSQQLRIPRYQALLNRLRDQGHVYACDCSRKQLAHGVCRCRSRGYAFTSPDVAWRLQVPANTMVRVPRWGGRVEEVMLHSVMPDPVLRQRNGRPAYQIASLADDVDHATTFIVRGADLLPSTACQLYLAELLGLEQFKRVLFLHHPLERDAAGHKLSKSQGAASLKALYEAGGSKRELEERVGALWTQLGLQ